MHLAMGMEERIGVEFDKAHGRPAAGIVALEGIYAPTH